MPTQIPTRQQYEARELSEFQRQLKECNKEGSAEFAAILRTNPRLVAERARWLLSGAYGWGSCHAAHNTLASPRMNRRAWLVQTIGAVEWNSSQAATVKSWKSLTAEQKKALDSALDEVIDGAEAEVKMNGRPA